MKKLTIILASIATIFTVNAATPSVSTVAKTAVVNKVGGWRVAWLNKREHAEKVLKLAQELNFNAVVVYWHKTKTPKFIKQARKFNLESLVNFQNELCDYARSIRPSIKISNHVWPVYQPKPLYGNQLNVDYCAQTVAWFFKPFWSDNKITNYTKTVIDDAQTYYPQQQGIPFLGYFNTSNDPRKSPKRLAHELDLIFANSPKNSKSIAIYCFSHLIKDPATVKAMKAVFKKYHIIKEDGK